MPCIVKVMRKIEDESRDQPVPVTPKPRMASRRKSVAFHWLDTNWSVIPPEVFDRVVAEVLGDSSGVKKRGPKPKQ
jgi:hypothetical protein